MHQRVRITGLMAAFMLAFAASPVIAASDDARAINQMRAANLLNAKKLLDQQGGSRVVFKVDADALREAMVTDLRDEVFKVLHDDRIPFSDLAVRQGNVEVRIADAKNQQKLLAKLVAPAASGTAAVGATYGDDGLMKLTPTDSGFTLRLQSLAMQSFEMMEQELRNNHIAAALQPVGDDRIAVLLPGLADPDRVAGIFSKRAKVAFRFVDSSMRSGGGAERLAAGGIRDRARLQGQQALSGAEGSRDRGRRHHRRITRLSERPADRLVPVQLAWRKALRPSHRG